MPGLTALLLGCASVVCGLQAVFLPVYGESSLALVSVLTLALGAAAVLMRFGFTFGLFWRGEDQAGRDVIRVSCLLIWGGVAHYVYFTAKSADQLAVFIIIALALAPCCAVALYLGSRRTAVARRLLMGDLGVALGLYGVSTGILLRVLLDAGLT